MKEIQLSRGEYSKALRHAHPLDRFDAERRVVDAIGRLTARHLDKNETFVNAVKHKQMTKAGNIWHNEANRIAKKYAARLEKLKLGANLESEKTIKYGKDGSRADTLFTGREGGAEFDWKTTARSALRSVRQMDRHADQFNKKTGAQLRIQEARNWHDYTRADARNAAKHLPVNAGSAKGEVEKQQTRDVKQTGPRPSAAVTPTAGTSSKAGSSSQSGAMKAYGKAASPFQQALQGKSVARSAGMAAAPTSASAPSIPPNFNATVQLINGSEFRG